MSFMKVPFPKPATKLKVYSKTSYLNNDKLAMKLLEKTNIKSYYGTGVKVLDVYPSNMIFSTNVYNYLEPSQHLLMEFRKDYKIHINSYLDNLRIPNTFEYVNLNPYDWESYLKITEENKILQPGFESRDHIHSKFLLTGAISEEGLIMQWLSCLAHQNWIQRFGNVKMLLWIPQATAIKITAPATSKARAKCSIACQTFSNPKLISIVNSPDMKKYDQSVLENDEPTVTDVKDFTSKVPMALIEINPIDCDVGNVYTWEYVVKNLMILGNQSLEESVKNLGPSSEEYFKEILSKDLLKTKVTHLQTKDFITVSNHFEKWPFKPNTMLEFLI